MVTEAVGQVLGDRAVGICDTPSGLCRQVAALLGRPASELWFDWFGLNHLGWLRGVHDADGDLLPGLLADDEALERLEEGRLFGAEWLRSLGMIPSEYLYYFYYGADTVEAIRRSPLPRGAFLREQQAAFYAGSDDRPADALAPGARRATSAIARTWPRRGARRASTARTPPGARATRARRWPSWRPSPPARARCGSSTSPTARRCRSWTRAPSSRSRAWWAAPGRIRVAVGDVPDHARALVQTIKAVERATIEAAITGSTALAVKAIALHPLVPSVSTARTIFAGYRAQLPELEERFAWA